MKTTSSTALVRFTCAATVLVPMLFGFLIHRVMHEHGARLGRSFLGSPGSGAVIPFFRMQFARMAP